MNKKKKKKKKDFKMSSAEILPRVLGVNNQNIRLTAKLLKQGFRYHEWLNIF